MGTPREVRKDTAKSLTFLRMQERKKKECRTITHIVKDGYQILGSPLHQKQEISDTARCVETALYVLRFCDLILHLYFDFNLNNFSNSTIHQLNVV